MYKEFLLIFDYELLVDFELVCISLNYPYKVINENGFFKILIPETFIIDVSLNFNEFLKESFENSNKSAFQIPFIDDNCSIFSWFLIFFIICLFFFSKINGNFYKIIIHGANDAYKVVNGEFYRCITSLTIHGNILHLVSNMIFLLLLLRYAVKIFGEGLAWFMIIISGFIGNLLTSFFYQYSHSSIGFSTSNFALIGILSDVNIKVLKSYIPLIAGFFLFIMLGGGKNVDIVAHFFGFFAGFIVTEIFLKRFKFLINDKNQKIFKIVVIIIIVFSWIFAFNN